MIKYIFILLITLFLIIGCDKVKQPDLIIYTTDGEQLGYSFWITDKSNCIDYYTWDLQNKKGTICGNYIIKENK